VSTIATQYGFRIKHFMKYRVLLLTLSLLLSACGGGDGDSSNGGSAPAAAEVLAPQARDSYDQLLTAN
jgi:hypothetical protein